MNKSVLLYLLILPSVLLPSGDAQTLDEGNLDVVIAKIEQTVRDGAAELERLYADRCDTAVIDACAKGYYDGCTSRFTDLQCLSGADITPGICGDGVSDCASLFDLDHSTTLLRRDIVSDSQRQLVEDPSVVESVCFSQRMDAFWARQREADESFWTNLGVSSPHVFFGSQAGSFRWYPGRPSDICGTFDPTIRPWYVNTRKCVNFRALALVSHSISSQVHCRKFRTKECSSGKLPGTDGRRNAGRWPHHIRYSR